MSKTISNYRQHKAKWKTCKRCELHECRNKVVLIRGILPADVLFIGEAPGISEDTCGRPFVSTAPSGGMLQSWIDHVDIERYALTNLIGCIPKNEDGTKVNSPPKFAIDACKPRLEEVLNLCMPKLVVLVGKDAGKYFPKMGIYTGPTVELVHPGAIVRSNIAQRGLAQQLAVVKLRDAVEEYC